GAVVAAGQKHIPHAVNIEQGQFSGNTCQQSYRAGQSDGIERTVATGSGRGKPDLIATGRPRDALNTVPAGGKSRLLSGQINHGNFSTIVAQFGVVYKS